MHRGACRKWISMRNNFDIIISLSELLAYSKKLIEKHKLHIYIEYWNDAQYFYYEELIGDNYEKDIFLSSEFRGLLLSAKKINPGKMTNFYDDKYSHDLIEVKGGRLAGQELEMIRTRILSKTPGKEIKLFYSSLQKEIKSDADFSKGVFWGNHKYDNIFYERSASQFTVWGDFSNKQYEIIIPEQQ